MSDEHYYERVADEVRNDKTKEGLWLKLLSECDGDEKRAKARYFRRRVQQLKNEERRIPLPENPTVPDRILVRLRRMFTDKTLTMLFVCCFLVGLSLAALIIEPENTDLPKSALIILFAIDVFAALLLRSALNFQER